METLTRDELRFLFEMRRRPCLSIFLPTHRAGREIEADRIRLKDLIRDAEAQLAAISIGKRHIRELLAPARSLIERREFWRYQRDGLAVFAAPGYFRYLRVPLPLQNFLFVSDRFDITPLLPLWTLEDGFYLLAISRKCTRLLEGTRFAVHETNNAAIPRSFNDALESMVDVSRREQRTAKAGMPSDLLLYFRAIDRGLRGLLNNHKLPLVLAAVEEEQRFYRDVNTYQKLLPEGVEHRAGVLQSGAQRGGPSVRKKRGHAKNFHQVGRNCAGSISRPCLSSLCGDGRNAVRDVRSRK